MIEYYDEGGAPLTERPDGRTVHIRVNRSAGHAGIGTVSRASLPRLGKRIMKLWERGSLGELSGPGGAMPTLFVVSEDHGGWPPTLRRTR